MKLPHDIDIHTHIGPLRPDAVLCVDPSETDDLPSGDGLMSVGIHPWNADKADDAVWSRFMAWLGDERVVAVGEIGLDRLRGPDMSVQLEVMNRQLRAAAERQLPVIIHCVRAYDLLLGVHFPEDMQRIVHGFRGRPALAQQLLDAGFDLSYGTHYNADSFALTPADRRYRETDTGVRRW